MAIIKYIFPIFFAIFIILCNVQLWSFIWQWRFLNVNFSNDLLKTLILFFLSFSPSIMHNTDDQSKWSNMKEGADVWPTTRDSSWNENASAWNINKESCKREHRSPMTKAGTAPFLSSPYFKTLHLDQMSHCSFSQSHSA